MARTGWMRREAPAPSPHLPEDRTAWGWGRLGPSGVGQEGQEQLEEACWSDSNARSLAQVAVTWRTHVRDPRVVHGRRGHLISCNIDLEAVPEIG